MNRVKPRESGADYQNFGLRWKVNAAHESLFRRNDDNHSIECRRTQDMAGEARSGCAEPAAVQQLEFLSGRSPIPSCCHLRHMDVTAPAGPRPTAGSGRIVTTGTADGHQERLPDLHSYRPAFALTID